MRLERLRVAAFVTGLALLALVGAAFCADRLMPPPLERLAALSALVVDRDGRIVRAYTTPEGKWRLPARVAEIDPKLIRFLLSYEDSRFHAHPGVDALAVGRATFQAIESGRIVSGASTLTMQLARLLEPRPRTLGAKLIEMARALQLEHRLSKEEILAAYLTFAPYGGNLEGVRAASLAYFGKEPARLTDAEVALLVALPQAPETVRPDRAPHQARAARDKVLRLSHARGLIGEAALQAALTEPVPTVRRPFPVSAPHLADRLRRSHPDETLIRTNLDDDLQRAVLEIVRRHQAALEPTASIAVLAVENPGRKVRAYVGSSDFFADRRFGQNDMVTAIRSPGSALKPFIYGMAFDALIVHPETLMPDVAMRFGDYAPRNFDDHFRGSITAREALQASLNIPAVALLDRIGPQRFVQQLGEAGVPLAFPAEAKSPGLPIALGGVGIDLEGLVALYAALADAGDAQALAYTPDAAEEDLPPLVSPRAAYYLTRILLDTPPPPRFLAAGNRRNAQPIAYKTGTSYGFRDAWAIGYTRNYTIGVWVGRPDGSFSAGRMGRDAAAPILFEAFDLLPVGPSALAAKPPQDVILAGTLDLPANLQRFRPRGAAGALGAAGRKPAIKLAFPVDGALLELAPAGQPLPSLTLEADGGALPLRWLVNGQPISSLPYRRQAEWAPDGRGAVRVTVIDRNGHSASSAVWIK